MNRTALLADIYARIEKEKKEQCARYYAIEKFLPEEFNIAPGEYLFKGSIRSFALTYITPVIIVILISLLIDYPNQRHYDNTELVALIFVFVVVSILFSWWVYYQLTARLILSEHGIQYRETDIIPWENILTIYIRIGEDDSGNDVNDYMLVVYHEDMMYSKINKAEYQLNCLHANYWEIATQTAICNSHYQRTNTC